jgi:hypothetical protein
VSLTGFFRITQQCRSPREWFAILSFVPTSPYKEHAIFLDWNQRVAAFWSVAWPGWLAGALLAFALTSGLTPRDLPRRMFTLSVISNVVILLVQVPMIYRLVHKQYRSFRVQVLRPDQGADQELSFREALGIWVQIIWPQLLFVVGVGVLLFITPQVINPIQSLLQLTRFLLVGPAAIQFALNANYSGFRLQAYGQRLT